MDRDMNVIERNSNVYQTYVEILRRELVSAMGCTEPIALAYCAAVARKTLGCMPDRIVVEASGNIIKNVKSVVVPNTGRRRGIATAAAIGVLAGDAQADWWLSPMLMRLSRNNWESSSRRPP